ncbi:MAG: NAD(P)/FAD-dependent oxidoreductase [Sphingobacteriales bacterium]|nr:MAG: NAD(P)/FAD-dependent oxidoreductase [Sphingobacteriales bacterium]TAF79962.1 MAG: NAD(P)/FAD-dependent oxidoreductase [Sphingobacteriales bacterium]
MAKPSIVIIGGGLAGLINAIVLSKADFEVTLIERKKYPFNRVCGEYISNEVLPFLNRLGIFPLLVGAAEINTLKVTSVNGNTLNQKLDLGGFGISRFKLDHLLYQKALACGTKFILETKVNEVLFKDEKFYLSLADEQPLQADLVIGSFGKRSNIDQKLNRPFFYQRSPYLGVKYHIKTQFPNNLIQLDNFEGGYCGISKIEDDLYCLCYLTKNSQLKKYGSIPEMEKMVLHKNHHLKYVFDNSDFVWPKPETINEISFNPKSTITNHIIMSGDSAGMIAPLCGNGMAMAIHSASLLSKCIIKHTALGILPAIRATLEEEYTQLWQQNFAHRLFIGRSIQGLFGSNRLSNNAVGVLGNLPKVSRYLISKTHGSGF